MSLEDKITDTNINLTRRITDLHGAITNQTRWMVGILGSLVATLIAGGITMAVKLGPVLGSLAEALK